MVEFGKYYLGCAGRFYAKREATTARKAVRRSFPHGKSTDVAMEAGLTQPVIYGGISQKNYIRRTVELWHCLSRLRQRRVA